MRLTTRFAPTELLIWFADWNYKHFAPTERYNRIDTQHAFHLMELPAFPFLGSRLHCVLVLLMLLLASPACIRRSRVAILSSNGHEQANQTAQKQANVQQSGDSPHVTAPSNQTNAQRININTAPAAQLEKLPGIGKGLAERIIEHRERFGPFRRIEHLIIVRGISDRRFRALRDLITVE